MDPSAAKYAMYSPYQYAANGPHRYIDPDGRDIVVLNSPDAAGGFGHTSVLVGSDASGWNSLSFEKSDGTSTLAAAVLPVKGTMSNEKISKTLVEVLGSGNSLEGEYDPESALIIRTTAAQDAFAIAYANAVKSRGSSYNLFLNNCLQMACRILNAAGIDLAGNSFIPNGRLLEYLGSSGNEAYVTEQEKRRLARILNWASNPNNPLRQTPVVTGSGLYPMNYVEE